MFARPPSPPSVRGRGRAAPLAAVALLVAATFAPAAPAHAEQKLGRVQKLEAREDGSRTVVTIHGTATPTFTVYKLEKPERVVVDVANAELGVRMDGPVAINTWAVGQIAAQELGEADAAVTRVIVQLARPSTYQVKAQGTDVVVTVTPREPKPSVPVAVDEASRADAQAARAEASKAKAEADRAKADASAAKADASAAKADAEAARAQANAAKADAEQTKRAAAQRAAEADKRLQTADERLRAADARMAQAEQGLREADTRKKQAEVAQKQAERALADADQRGKAADEAARAAEKQRAAAERAAAEAAQVARRAEAAGDVDAARKRKDAEDAAARAEARRQDAEAKRKAAEDAAARADARRQDAERARADAESSRSQAEQAKQDAQRQKQLAERDRDKARSERDAAEKARVAAEKARIAEEQRAQVVAEKRAQEEERTRAAEGARSKEEQAARAAGEQRKRAEAARVEAESALASVQARRTDAEKARVAAEGRAREADKAAREAEEVARAKGKQSDEWKRADERARALEERQRVAEAELVQRKRALADEQVNADRAAAQRDAAVAAAGSARSEAEKARAQRQAEEKRKAQVEAERIVEEKKLAEAKRARVAEEGKLAVAEQRRRDAEDRAVAEQKRREAEMQAAEAKRAAAEEQRAAAEQQRREAEAQAAEAKRAAAEQRQREAEAVATRKAAEAKAAPVVVAKAAPVVVAKAAPAPAKAAPAPAPAKAAPAPVAAKPATTPVAPASAAEKPSKNVRVANVDYVDRDQHARVVVQLSGPAEPQVIASSGRQAILSIPGVDIPASLERSLDTSEFSGPVTAISSYRDPRDPGRVRIVVDLAEPAQAKLVRAGNTWYWDFEKPAAVARATPKAKRPTGAPAARAVTYDPPVIGGYGAASTPVTSQTVAQKKKVYRGKRIDLDFKDADLHNLLRLLAQVGDVNIVIPDDVKATVTVRLTDVPWDQAMEVILQSKGLWYRREGRLIRVADRKLLDAEDEEERARKRALVQEESPESVIFTLNYSVAEDVGQQARTLLSPKGKLEVDKRTNSLVITDVKANRSRIIDLLTQLDTQTPQIQIEARIVEARSTWSREIGVQWGFNALASAAGGNPTGLIFPSSIGVAGGATDNATPTGGLVGNPDFAVNLPATVGTGSGGAVGFNFGSVGGNFNLQLRLSAAEEQGAVRIVSAPKITVLNNIEATISQGVSIPIQVVSANGAQTSFVQADLKLTVTPHVSQRDCSIQLEVQVTKNEPDFVNTGARGDPSILTKVAQTTMLIGDGETSVIGGIYTRNTGKSYSKVPFLGDIPILGFFFRQKRENDDRTEVLIFLSPKITNKASLRCEGRPAN